MTSVETKCQLLAGASQELMKVHVTMNALSVAMDEDTFDGSPEWSEKLDEIAHLAFGS